jgi:hypothetical protein
MEIKTPDFSVFYNEANHLVEFAGTIRLKDSGEYVQISDILTKAYGDAQDVFTLDLKQLEFLNSGGINAISKFVLSSKRIDKAKIIVLGNKDIYWQQKSLVNLRKLWNKVEVEIK